MVPLSFFLINCGFLSILIWALINNISQDKSQGWIIFGIILLGSLACFGLYGFLFSIVRQKVILTADYIQVKSYYILCFLNRSKIFNYIDIKSFQVDTILEELDSGTRDNRKIVCYDNSNKKENVFDIYNFGLEEAEYLVYVVNEYIKKKKCGNNVLVIKNYIKKY